LDLTQRRKDAEAQRKKSRGTKFEAQMLTYLRLTGLKLGLVINFGESYVKNGIYRVVNGL